MIVAFVGLFQSNILELMSVVYDGVSFPIFLQLSLCSQMLNNRTLDTTDHSSAMPFFNAVVQMFFGEDTTSRMTASGLRMPLSVKRHMKHSKLTI